MALTNRGGTLQPKPHTGETVDAVYGVDAAGKYLGVVPTAQAASHATTAPMDAERERWDGRTWQPYKSREQRAAELEQERDDRIDQGVTWSARVWYADPLFQQQLAAYLQAYTEGMFSLDATVDVRSRDKVIYPLKRDELRELSAAVLEFVQAEYARCWALKAAIQE